VSQHAGLSADRWRAFTLDQQLLMIANEMNRASKLLGPDDRSRLLGAYERTLRLVDLTAEVQRGLSIRRELLRWRELVAKLYLDPADSAREHGAAMKALLQFSPATYAQLAHLSIPASN
jgi:hypothetical protein